VGEITDWAADLPVGVAGRGVVSRAAAVSRIWRMSSSYAAINANDGQADHPAVVAEGPSFCTDHCNGRPNLRRQIDPDGRPE
jgi:hypothetical protein